MNDRHEPDPAYLEHLRWQVASEARRRARFPSEPVKPLGRGGRLRNAALLSLGLAMGTAGTVAAGEYQRWQDRDVLEAAAKIELELARDELTVIVAEHERARQMQEFGRISRASVVGIQAEEQALQARVRLLELDAAEVHASGQAPDRLLSANAVGGVDYVRARLVVQQAHQSARFELRGQLFAVLQMRVQEGLSTSMELERGQAEMAEIEEDLRRATARLALRDRYLAKELNAQQVELADRLDAARAALDLANQRLRFAQRESEIHEVRQRAGYEPANPRLALAVTRQEAKRELARIRLQALLQEGQDLPKDLLEGPPEAPKEDR